MEVSEDLEVECGDDGSGHDVVIVLPGLHQRCQVPAEVLVNALELVSCKERKLLVPAEYLHPLSGPTMVLSCWNRRPVART